MEEYENIYDKIKELLGSIPARMNVLEDTIDIELQLEYFELSRRLRNRDEPHLIMNSAERLFEDSTSLDEKKNLLAQIASLDKIEAYRAIERFQNEKPGDLKSWSTLALHENRMLLESKLLDENHVFISTGLGGRGEKLRYFIVLFARESEYFSELQRKIIKNEFEMSLKKHSSEMEEIKFSGSMATILAMIPMKINIRNIFNEAIEESNQYGNFLVSNFIISNVKTMSFEEIKHYVKTQNKARALYPNNSYDI